MAIAARKAALKLPGWSDTEKKKPIKGEAILKLDSQLIMRTFLTTEISTLVSKSKEQTLDLSSPQFQLESSIFLREIPDSFKMYVYYIFYNALFAFIFPLQAPKLTFPFFTSTDSSLAMVH
jgi:hypothetical protein